jgi:hypothetical protein
LTPTSPSSSTRRFIFVSRRAERTDFVGVDADGSVVLAKNYPRDVFGHVLGTHVRVQRDVSGAFEVVRVFVETHCFGGWLVVEVVGVRLGWILWCLVNGRL